MLGELQDLTLAPITLAVAVVFATLGCLLGTIVAARARRSTGARRVRLVLYATLAVAGPAIWLPALVATLGLRVDGSIIRLEPIGLGLSLAAALGATASALLVVCYGRVGPHRVLLASLLLTGGIAACAFLTMSSIVTGAPVSYLPVPAGAALVIVVVSGFALAGTLGAARSLRSALVTSALVAPVLALLHAVAAMALHLLPGPGGMRPAYEVPGVAPMRIAVPAVVLGAAAMAMLWYFSLGSATRRELRLIFEPGTETEQIEPWIIDQVRTRVALSSTAMDSAPSWAGDVWAANTVAVRAIPVVGGAMASAFAGSWAGTGAARAAATPDDVPPWRPVPGWDMPGATRPVLRPATGAASDTTESVRQGVRPAGSGDHAEWDRDPVERNDAWRGGRGRGTNTRQGTFPSRSPAPVSPAPYLVPAHGNDRPEPTPIVRAEGGPLPRRNARG